jgi:hypothetical protein
MLAIGWPALLVLEVMAGRAFAGRPVPALGSRAHDEGGTTMAGAQL